MPHLVIGILALVGLFGWGLKGLILGAIAGFVFNLLFGSLLTMLSGGLLPRKLRKQTASRFIILYPELAQNVIPNTSERSLQKSVERSIEAIFKRSGTDNRSLDLVAALDITAIRAAAAALISEEQRPEMKKFLDSLEQHIEREMYPDIPSTHA